mmetsp:Transcript_33903/g.85812  ORF Transcript_33903/g.85812 Transcript_33903/m.85812 type:complete len:127 (-) Transcript_33903:316-696(-)
MMLASSVQVSGLLRSPVATRHAAVVVRADNPRVTEGRTFREDDGQMSGKPTNASGAGSGPLYADEVARAPAAARKDNLSKEMKKRLRQEYTGFGGAENSAMSSNYFLWIIVFISALAVASKITGAI